MNPNETPTPPPLPVRLALLSTRVAVLRQNVEWLQAERAHDALRYEQDLHRYRKELFAGSAWKG